jgi:dihydrodipicolinate synthase/N-acetylneuraminate lyase
MSPSSPLQGIFTPNIVPLDRRGEIDEGELRRYVDWLIERGVHGLYPNGSTGEFTRFTAEERRRIIEIIADHNRDRVPILAGAAEANTRETIRACERYAELGVRAVAIVSPFYYKLSPAGVYAYFKEIADHSPIDVTLYNIPMFASPIDVPTVRRLAAECPRVAAIKDSSGDLPHMMRMIAAVKPVRPDFAFLTGWDAALMPMLLIGCDGGTNATSGVVPEITRKLYDLTLARELDQARDLQYRLLKLFDAMIYSAEFPEGFRAALQLRGIHTGRGRQPQSDVQEQALEQLRGELQCLLAAEGFTDEPIGGCPAGEPIDTDQVARIVRQVLGELQRRGAR